MPSIHVCSLAYVKRTVETADASHLVSLINVGTAVDRPPAIAPERHLFIGVSDVVSPIEGMVLPEREHVEELLAFVAGWDQARPMVVHCFAGISRSTAAAFIALCQIDPARPERDAARAIRSRSPTASPNPRLVALADALLGRSGRMIEAIAEIGDGNGAFEADPFSVPIGES